MYILPSNDQPLAIYDIAVHGSALKFFQTNTAEHESGKIEHSKLSYKKKYKGLTEIYMAQV